MSSQVGTKGLLLQVWCIVLVFFAEEIKTHLSIEAALKGHVIINIRPRKFPSSSGFVGV